ncbi:MAG: pyrophosphatase PpaX [Bacillota bacterium]
MAQFSVVLFDLDGTLIDTNGLIVSSFQHAFRTRLGREVPAEEIYPYFGEPLPRTMARYAPDRVDELVEHYRAYNIAVHDQMVQPFPGVPEAVAAMHEASRLGIVTSKKGDLARRGLRVCGLEPFFPTLVGMDDTTRHKPDPEPVLEALRRMGEPPGPHVLMVGDSPFDVGCGRNAGVLTVGVGWTANRAALETSRPDYWVESPAELLGLMQLQPRHPGVRPSV